MVENYISPLNLLLQEEILGLCMSNFPLQSSCLGTISSSREVEVGGWESSFPRIFSSWIVEDC